MWLIIKKFWYVPIILVLIVLLAILYRSGNNPAMEILKKAIESYKKEKEVIDKLNQQGEQEKKKLEETYKVVIQELEKKYQNDKTKLDNDKKNDIKLLLYEYKNNPEELTKILAKEFGLEWG